MERLTLELGDKKYGAKLDFQWKFDVESRADMLAEIVKRTYLQHYGFATTLPEEN